MPTIIEGDGDRTTSEAGSRRDSSTEPGQGGGTVTNGNGKGSGNGKGKGNKISRARSKKKKSCNKLKGIARVKCVLSKFKGSGKKAVGPNVL